MKTGNEMFQTPSGMFFNFNEEGILEIPLSKAIWQEMNYIPTLDKNFNRKDTNDIDGITFFGKYTMIMDDYAAYVHDMVANGVNKSMPSDEGWGYRKRPAINLDLYQACEYINWLNRQYGSVAHEHPIRMDLDERGEKFKMFDGHKFFQHRYVVDRQNSSISRARVLLDENGEPVIENGEEVVIIAPIVDDAFENYVPGFQLPTSEEWVTAADNVQDQTLEDIAWFADNSDNMTHPVGEKLPNNYGLHDMLGNVWERVIEFEKDNTEAIKTIIKMYS